MDLLVRLYDLPPALTHAEVRIRRAMPYETTHVVEWIAATFNREWADQAEIAFHRQPIGCVIATRDAKAVGFACWDATARGFFGPIGVDPALRRVGIGRALTLAALHEMRSAGYGYAIIGGAGDAAFYASVCGAIEIPGSSPGLYTDRLR